QARTGCEPSYSQGSLLRKGIDAQLTCTGGDSIQTPTTGASRVNRRSTFAAARQVPHERACHRGEQDDQQGDQEGVERLEADRPEDDPDDETGDCRDHEAHAAREFSRWSLVASR